MACALYYSVSRDKKNHETSLKFLSGHLEFVTVYLGLVSICLAFFQIAGTPTRSPIPPVFLDTSGELILYGLTFLKILDFGHPSKFSLKNIQAKSENNIARQQSSAQPCSHRLSRCQVVLNKRLFYVWSFIELYTFEFQSFVTI